ncbi:Membrane-bound metallopeptidase [Variovorax sp. HW608]|uniref:DNA-binding protein n=1 Tax=Variovorax sp. HW608 TaxID=1034889 RepID=UPI0008202169|nr:DNA-binding protein [Variovorax sp. HW608]SCK11266.1 Membrane-bound metallopeptidase [Variovorax sp. HW608]
MTENVHLIRIGRGVQEAQVWEAADALLQEGMRPTIERVRHRLGGGSPNTVSPMLERWFATLGRRLGKPDETLADSEARQLPLAIVHAAQQIWEAARREAEQVQIQRSEASRRELELERATLLQREAELRQREASLEESRSTLEEALAASRRAVEAMQVQMHTQQQESARLLSESALQVQRLRSDLHEAAASKEALREKAQTDLENRQRQVEEAEQRRITHERRLLSEIDREREAVRHAAEELAKERQARVDEREVSLRTQDGLKQALEDLRSSHWEVAQATARDYQEIRIELAAMRERAAAAESRVSDLTSQLQRQREIEGSQIGQLNDTQAALAHALHQLKMHSEERSRPSRAGKFKAP